MKTIQPAELQTRKADDLSILDVSAHPGSEIRGAIRYHLSDLLNARGLVLPLARDRTVVIYADAVEKSRVAELVERLEAAGYTDVRLFDGNVADYERAGGATQELSLAQPVVAREPEDATR
jgi:rhodanese-related sulfurtransferase